MPLNCVAFARINVSHYASRQSDIRHDLLFAGARVHILTLLWHCRPDLDGSGEPIRVFRINLQGYLAA